MATSAQAPEIYDIPADYSSETARDYNREVSKDIEKKQALANTESEKFQVLAETYYKALYADPKVTQSQYSFLKNDTYTDTDANDKTDTYVNMNTSFRYIRYNLEGAGDLYNKLLPGCDYKKDTPEMVFAHLKYRLVQLGFDKIFKDGKRTENPFESDLDFMYAVGLFQAQMEKKVTGASKKDFRVGPRTITALLQGKAAPQVTAEVSRNATPEQMGSLTREQVNALVDIAIAFSSNIQDFLDSPIVTASNINQIDQDNITIQYYKKVEGHINEGIATAIEYDNLDERIHKQTSVINKYLTKKDPKIDALILYFATESANIDYATELTTIQKVFEDKRIPNSDYMTKLSTSYKERSPKKSLQQVLQGETTNKHLPPELKEKMIKFMERVEFKEQIF